MIVFSSLIYVVLSNTYCYTNLCICQFQSDQQECRC